MFKYNDRYLEIASRLYADFASKDNFDKSRANKMLLTGLIKYLLNMLKNKLYS